MISISSKTRRHISHRLQKICESCPGPAELAYTTEEERQQRNAENKMATEQPFQQEAVSVSVVKEGPEDCPAPPPQPSAEGPCE